MTPGWYKTLKRSALYRAFLAHRVWTVRTMASSGVLYCFPLITLLTVWWFLPVTVLSVSWLLAAPSAGVSEHAMPGLALLQLAYIVAAGPIALRALHDTFRGYFAGFSESAGHSQTFRILTAGTHRLIGRSIARAAEDLPNRRTLRLLPDFNNAFHQA